MTVAGFRGKALRMLIGACSVFVGVVGVCVATAASQPNPWTALLGPSAACYFGTNQWQRVQAPAGAKAPVSIQALDQSPCGFLAADAAGGRWSSKDAGKHWTRMNSDSSVRKLHTEALQPRMPNGRGIGPLIATGPAATGGLVSQVFRSGDSGRTFDAVQVTTPTAEAQGVAVPAGPAAGPLLMSVTAAVTAVHYDSGVATPYVYLAGRPEAQSLGALPAGNAATLLRSTDGGQSFATVVAPERLTPTAIAINPTSSDEVWVNNKQSGAPGGGAWISTDSGQSFSPAPGTATATVNDISIRSGHDGSIEVLLATDKGLMRSTDDGNSWDTISDGALTGVRTAPDDGSTFIATTPDEVKFSSGQNVNWHSLPGLPSGCGPTGLRVNDQVPPTFLVDCAKTGGTYRLLLTGYGQWNFSGSLTDTLTLPCFDIGQGCATNARQLNDLATWFLPNANNASGSIAFDGTLLYYDMNTPGEIGRVRATDGVFVGAVKTNLDIFSLSFDLTRNNLLVTTPTGDLDAINIRTLRVTKLSFAPYKVPSYDSSMDGLTWVPELGNGLFHRGLTANGVGNHVCDMNLQTNANSTSTFVASGDGGGYVQSEDDSTIYRVDGTCRLTGVYQHRHYSESGAENDAMACDTQTYFPQPAIWIRDSQPMTVSSYGVPFGYCPMPSRLTVTAPQKVLHGAVALICTELRNATNGRPGAGRGITITVEGTVVGHGQTDNNGRACVLDHAPAVVAGKLPLAVGAVFAGDSGLFPSSAHTVMTVLGDEPAPPPHPPRLFIVPPPPPPPVVANPPVNAPAPGNAPNPAQAPQGQTQPQSTQVLQGVVVPEAQQQPQLALQRAANELQADGNAMTAPRPRRPLPINSGGVAALLGIASAAAVGTARALAPARVRRRSGRR